jgi:hypothetical protein
MGHLAHAARRVAGRSAGGALPRTLLVAGSVASLAANVAVAERSLTGRVIAALPSFAPFRVVGAADPRGTLQRSGRQRAGSAAGLAVRDTMPGQDRGWICTARTAASSMAMGAGQPGQ